MDAKQGLYTSAYEHDACGVGMVVNIHGGKSHELVDNALRVLENMQHRGAETRDKTGDGAGIMVQIPHEFILLQGIPVPEKGRYGTGLVFLPREEKLQNQILNIMIEEIEREGLELMHLRNVPVNEDVPGVAAREVMPDIRQMFVAPMPSLSTSSEGEDAVSLETKLYKVRKRIERRVLPLGIDSFYICSLSSKNIVYKGMLTSGQLRRFYQDLTNPYFTSGLALVHSRFSTNTFPKWKLAQPFRLLCHNGEINTVRGNRAWMKARESVLSSGALGDIKDILPIVEDDMSDSASLDNVFEFLIMSGMSLPQAMAILVPESFNDKNPISEDLKAFYEYYSILMEPWDGPAALMFSDGRYAGGMLDRNGLRPSRYTITKSGMMVVASEVGAMSFGALSIEAHEALALAMNRLGARSNTGEGGEDNVRYHTEVDGVSLSSKTKQIASGRFGVTAEYLVNAEELQIKVAQGAKPGEGGQLPGFKVNKIIAKTRNAIPGITLISPPPHHDIYSIEDLAQLIFDLKNINPTAAVSVKLVAESGVGTIAAGVAKAKADLIVISGAEGGTGASPVSSMRFAGISPEIGLAEAQQTLVLNGLRDQVRLQTDGQLKTARDVIIMAMLGADEFSFGTLPLIVLGCLMMRKCNTNTCPVGVATQDETLRAKFRGRAEYVVNFFMFLAQQTREYLSELGVRHLKDIIGRTDMIEVIPQDKSSKLGTIDFSRLLHRPDTEKALYWDRSEFTKVSGVKDEDIISACAKAIENQEEVNLDYAIKNTDRAVTTMLSGVIAKRYGEEGLPDSTINIKFKGSAGQSFGAFAVRGINVRLEGEANDYFAKGLSGGRISILPPSRTSADFVAEDNIIAGNTGLYGATGGELYVNGRVGERFGVRNSGATAVVEGAGDHCCEYMTGGRVVVLGQIGRNFAAGMSGGLAYVWDREHTFDYFCNMDQVEISLVEESSARKELHELIRQHYLYTGSALARRMLDDWNRYVEDFILVTPIEYKRVLQEEKMRQLEEKIANMQLINN